MTTFLESPRFPDNIAFGATVGPTYLTVVTPVYSGRDGRIVAWQQARIRFEVGQRSKNAADTATLDAFFRVVKGRAYGFRIKDWTDYTCTTAQGVLTPLATPGTYQLGKVYTQGALTETRLIQKPVAGTVACYDNGVLISSGLSLDTTTGIVTLTASATQGITNVALGATTTVTLASALSGITTGGTIAFSGIGGTAGAVLNGKTWTVAGVSGAAYTINVNTTGLTVVSAGTAYKYPQPSEALTWSGQFDVPVRFDVDEMKKQIMDRNGAAGDLLVDWGSIPIIEIRI